MHLGLGIKTTLKNIILKIILFFGSSFVFLLEKYKIAKIKFNPNIKIGINLRMSNTSKIKIVDGGSIEIGNNVEIMDGVLILTYGGNIKIGDNCSINPYTIIYGHGNTIIGNDVLIAGQCMIIPNNHKFERKDIPIREQGNSRLPIEIEEDVWIGHGCTILEGIKIEKGAIIAAGSVVNKNVPKYSIYGGIPAKLLKKRNE